MLVTKAKSGIKLEKSKNIKTDVSKLPITRKSSRAQPTQTTDSTSTKMIPHIVVASHLQKIGGNSAVASSQSVV